jgi:hypothetical protein
MLNLSSRSYQQQVLAEHDLFRQLSGNPHAITLLACCRANPSTQKNLNDIYEMVLSDRVQSVIVEEGTNLPSNEISLRISTETIINFLQDTNVAAYTFLYFLSMLPQGALPN